MAVEFEMNQKTLPGMEEFSTPQTTEKKEPATRISPSLIEHAVSDVNAEVTREEMEGSIAGYSLHKLDNIANLEIRERLANDKQLQTYIVEEARRKHDEWKSEHVFMAQPKRTRNRRKDREIIAKPLTEGHTFSAEAIEDYWNSQDLRLSEQSLLDAHYERIYEYSIKDPNEGTRRPLLLESDPNAVVLTEEEARYEFDMGYTKVQMNARFDYLIHNPDTEEIVIVDLKTGKNPMKGVSKLQVFAYMITAKHHINVLQNQESRGFRKEDYHAGKIPFPSNVRFYYRHIQQFGRKRKFVYSEYTIEPADWEYRWEQFQNAVGSYQSDLNEVNKTRKIRQAAFVMPRIPDPKEVTYPRQKTIYQSES